MYKRTVLTVIYNEYTGLKKSTRPIVFTSMIRGK